MATTSRLNNGCVLNQPHKAYITTGAFSSAIFSYSTSTSLVGGNWVTTGTLTALGSSVVTGTYDVAGTILRENGKKLVPGVNPDISEYYVGVYHPVFGSGFIDPNNALFALYNSDKPYLYNGADLLLGDQGPPVLTGGSVTAAGQIRSSTLTSATYTYSSGSATVNIDIDPTLGQTFKYTFQITGGTNSFSLRCPTTPAIGSVVYVILFTNASHNTTANVAEGTNVQMRTVTLGTTASQYFGLTFVSDGANLICVGASVTAVAE